MEAVAFGAAGALFGVQVQRQRVDDAKQRADKSDKIAADNHEAASNGRALAALVKAEAGGGGGVKVERFVAGSGAADSGADEPASLALAKALFPG
ncbi:MAG: hypothetical protein ABI056_07470 [Caulobacteraceae bacterium]